MTNNECLNACNFNPFLPLKLHLVVTFNMLIAFDGDSCARILLQQERVQKIWQTNELNHRGTGEKLLVNERKFHSLCVSVYFLYFYVQLLDFSIDELLLYSSLETQFDGM